MKKSQFTLQPRKRLGAAFTIVEALIAAAIVGVVFVSLYAAMATGFASIQTAREGLNAAQILEDKFETIRLYTWDQVNSNSFIPSTFLVPMPTGPTNGSLNYTGQVIIADSPVAEPYSNDLRQVTVQLTWQSGNRLCTRSMKSFIARNGLQNYVY